MNKPKPSSVFVNSLLGYCEMHVEGSLYQGRLDKKVRAILASLPPGSFVMPPKALWKLYASCDGSKVRDAYEIRFQVVNAQAVQAALYA